LNSYGQEFASYVRQNWKRFLDDFIWFVCTLLIIVFLTGPPREFLDPRQKETWPPSSNSPNNDTQTKSTTLCHKQGISTTQMNWWIVI
jgi:hypothetical protein